MKKANGQGSISYEEDRKQYRAAFTDPYGKRVRKRFNTKKEAEEWLTLMRADVYNNEYVPESGYTVQTWMLEYLPTYAKPKVKQSTYVQYVKHAESLAKIADIKLTELDTHSLQKFFLTEFKDRPEKGRQVYCILSSALKKAKVLGIIRNNPLEGVQRPTTPKKEKEIFTPEEINMILEYLKTMKCRSKYNYDIVLVAISTGMRLGEIVGLKRDCVFEDHIYVEQTAVMVYGKTYINTPKTARSKRNISISKSLYEHLMALPVHENGYLFVNSRGNIYQTMHVEYIFRKAIEQIGIPYRTFHALRHTHASWLLESGEFTIQQVSSRLGHASSSITLDVYSHLMPCSDTKIPDKINQILSVAPTLPPQ